MSQTLINPTFNDWLRFEHSIVSEFKNLFRKTLKIHLRTEAFRIHTDLQVVVELGTTGTVFLSRHLFVGTQIKFSAVWMLKNDYIVGWFVDWALYRIKF